METYICGFFYNRPDRSRAYLPQIKLTAHASIVSSVSRTTLTQTFINPNAKEEIKEVRYVFPLYDGVSVVAFTCTLGDRVIKGVVKEKQKAREVFEQAVARGETAGLLEQIPDSADVFSTTVGNIPAGAFLKVEITYLGELKHDAEVDGIRFTIPTAIAPRYGNYPGELLRPTPEAVANSGIQITVDAEMPNGSTIRAVQSPSHPISVSIGATSSALHAEPSLQKASASLALNTAELDKDFIVQIIAANTGNPVAVLEEHPTITGHRAIMATLVPKFVLPAERPEVVFVCDRSGSMGTGQQMPNLISALKIFLKSLPVGVKFNICSFGSYHSFLWDKSRTYDQTSLEQAMRHVATFNADFGGTEIYRPIEATFSRRYKDMNLEVFLITDGQVWNQESLFAMIGKHVADSNGAIRVFSLGIGAGASHALIEGVARAGNGFSQAVSENEKMDGKIVRMLKGALTPHVNDYTLDIKYEATSGDNDFEMVDKAEDSLAIRTVPAPQASSTTETLAEKTSVIKKAISLFDPSANLEAEITNKGSDNKYDHLPTIDIPKILQSPAKIPPLFPFSRTSVYLLISPSATIRTPKSIILRATSTHGPLELEIPLTTLEATGETIHQLAARKAVKELEEGRGWLYHAKDADGKLLKDAYEGRFSDMVEREAVRLGVQYQVSGKWCSFVAVEPGFEERAANTATQETLDSEDELDTLGGITDVRAFCPLPRQCARASPRQMQQLAASSCRRSRAVAGRGMVRKMPNKKEVVTNAVSFGLMDPDVYLDRDKGTLGEMDVDDDSNPFVSFSDIPVSPLEALVAMQTFEGYWEWSDDLLRTLGLERMKIDKVLEANGTQWGKTLQDAANRNIVATACVVVYLRTKLSGEKDSWEMIVDKAVDWLAASLQGVGPSVEELQSCLATLF